MKKILLFLSLGLIFVVGATAAVALADKPPAPPGQDPCSHGNTGKPCRPDPSDNGKDCDYHGNQGGVNEDHCKQDTTTTTTTTTDTTTTTQTTTTNTTTTDTTGTTTTGTTPTTTEQTTTTSTTPGETSNQTTTEPQSQPGPNKPPVSKPSKTPHNRSVSPPKGKQQLPFTGLPLWVFIILGTLMGGGGLALRRV